MTNNNLIELHCDCGTPAGYHTPDCEGLNYKENDMPVTLAYAVDSLGTLHTRSTCEEFAAPAVGSLKAGTPAEKIAIHCADCCD